MSAILITGAGGFIGSHLAPYLVARGHTVVASTTDVTDRDALAVEIGRAAPAILIHLAAISHVPTCEQDPERARAVNVGGTANVLAVAGTARVVFPSSSHVYRAADLLDEDSPLEPTTVYARTKLDGEQLVRDTARAATVLRLFNHTHRTQSPEFFLPRIYGSLVEHRGSGRTISIPVGNTHVARDVGSVQDLLAAFGAIVGRTASGCETFNVCSGVAKPLSELVDALAARLGVVAELVFDPARARAGEPSTVCGSHARLTTATGWRPTALTAEAVVDAFLADLA